MPYITSIERLGMRRGRQEALHQFILENLELEHGKVPEELAARVTAITDQERLKELARASARAEELDTFRRRLDD